MRSSRIAWAWPSASSGVSANFTPPAFMRPPESTCDLMTTGPPMSAAAVFASVAVLQKWLFGSGIPTVWRICFDSYS